MKRYRINFKTLFRNMATAATCLVIGGMYLWMIVNIPFFMTT